MLSKCTKPRPAVKRSLKILVPIQPNGAGEVRISCGPVVETYHVQTFPAYDGAATGVALTKRDGTTYHACLTADPSDSCCECRGYLRWSHCKHLDALRTLAERGELPLPVPEAETEAGCDELLRDSLTVLELAGC